MHNEKFHVYIQERLQHRNRALLEQKQAMTKRWIDWMASIAVKNRLEDRGNRLEMSGKVVKSNSTVNGPFVEIKESIGGYSLVKAESYEDAIEMAKSCRILPQGGHVEIRELSVL